MIIDKVCFIHLREQNEIGEYHQNGGATIAWKVDANHSLVVGYPARCHETDAYVKADGRDRAQSNLDHKQPLFVLSKDDLTAMAIADVCPDPMLTPAVNQILKNHTIAMIADDVMGAVASNWFEGVVRERFTIKDNILRFNGYHI